MRIHPALFSLAIAAWALAGCAGYSKVTKKSATYQSPTPAGQLIARTLKHPAKQPQVQIGRYLDAVAAAAAVLRATPGDTQARADYNFAVARIFEIVHDAGLEPWKAPLQCPGASQEWNFSLKADRAAGAQSVQLQPPARRPLSIQGQAGGATSPEGRARSAAGGGQQDSMPPRSIPSPKGNTSTTA